MSIVKLPKKIRDIFTLIRNGEIEDGLSKLEKISGLEPQKALIYSQINYFKEEYLPAMKFDEQALPFHEQWYAGNILKEHFFAYSNAALAINETVRAKKFYIDFLENKNQLGKVTNVYKHQVDQHLLKLEGHKNLIIDKEKLKIVTEGDPIEKYFNQYKKIRPKGNPESPEGINYVLHFLITNVNTEECLNFHEKNIEIINNEDHHLNIALLYLASNQIEKAQKSILYFATKTWRPIEHLQVVPMRLFYYEELLPILNKELKKKILFSKKAIIS